MKGRMQKISIKSDNCLEKNRTESDDYQGVQTYIGITENNLMEVQQTKDGLPERILSPGNLNRACKQELSNKGIGGVDGMQTKELLSRLLNNKSGLLQSIASGKYRPNPVRRVEMPKDGGKKLFDTVSHSQLIELLSKRIKDGRAVSLIHKYLLSVDELYQYLQFPGRPRRMLAERNKRTKNEISKLSVP
ncbi:MAG: hypothetical protein LBG96_05360 [Tannerella sp.]|jgi:retron-type reverse transcriptase|nr:hypothetical protein [Tannerella sp.]